MFYYFNKGDYKLAEYWVSHKRMNADGTRIDQVKTMMKKPEGGLNIIGEYTRNQVVNSIENDNDWFTCIFDRKEGKMTYWNKGEEIHIITVNGTKFIRTDKNETESDNLNELPDF